MPLVCDLNYKKYGEEGSIVIILHGLFGMLDNWSSFARQLGHHYQVFVVDQRNHGKSCHSEEMNYDLMVADLIYFMDAQGLQKAHWVGHSMGGKVAMNLALTHPERTNSLTVLDIAPRAYAPVHTPIFQALKSIDLNQEWTRSEIADKLAQKIPRPAIVQFLMKNLAREGVKRFRWKMNLEAIHRAYASINEAACPAKRFFGSVLFVKGGRSDYIQQKDMEAIRMYFPNAKLSIIAEAGHWLHAEKPKELMELLTEFIGELEI